VASAVVIDGLCELGFEKEPCNSEAI